MYDVTQRTSLESVEYWCHAVDSDAGKETIKILVANKVDVEEGREVTEPEGRALLEDPTHRGLGLAAYWEMSARTGLNVHDAFQALAQTLADRALLAGGGAAGTGAAGGGAAGPR